MKHIAFLKRLTLVFSIWCFQLKYLKYEDKIMNMYLYLF